MQIQLQDCSFFGFHGMHEEEKKLGNTFIVNLTVDFNPPSQNITQINETVDYVGLYQIVEQRMLQTTPLLETIVQDIANKVLEQFPLVDQVQLSITKMHLPIPRFEGKATVSLTKRR